MRCGQLGVVERPDSIEESNTNSGEEPGGVQQSRHTWLSSNVKEASQNDPAAGDEHGVFPGDNFAQDAGSERAEKTSELEDRSEPACGCRGFDDCRKVFRKAGHHQTLSQNTLLISILESTEAGRMSAMSLGDFGRSQAYEAKNAMNKTLGLLLMEPQIVAFMSAMAV